MTDQNNSTNDVDDIDVTDASDVAGVAEVDATGETANVTKQDVPYRSDSWPWSAARTSANPR